MADSTPGEKFEAGPSNFPLKQIRTFQGDVASALKDQSLFSIEQSEELKRASGGALAVAESSSPQAESLWLILGGGVLIILGLVGAWFGYREYLKKTAPPTLEIPASRLISVQAEGTLNFASTTREMFPLWIAEQVADLPESNLKNLVLKNGSGPAAPLVSTAALLAKLETQAPSALVRAFDPLFMLGSLGQSRFLIIKLASFESAFPGMLAWEATLPQDLAPLFANASTLKSIGSNAVFKDVISKNKDVRVLPLEQGESSAPVLLYSFFENRLLIITESLPTLQTVLDRLTRELLIH